MIRPPAPALVLCSVVSVQFGQALGKTLFGEVGPQGVVALRLGLAAVLLLLIHRPALPRNRADVATILGFGTAIAGMNLVYPALHYLPLGVATTLQLLGPITLALLTSRRAADLALAAVAGFGIWLFHAPSSTSLPAVGVLFALASGVAMASYLLLSKRAGSRSTGGGPLALAVAWAAVLTIPAGVAESGAALLTPSVLGFGLLVAVLSAVVPYSLELTALRSLPPRIVGVLQSLEPAAAGLAGAALLAEQLSVVQWSAIGCVCAASVGVVLRSTPEKVSERATPRPRARSRPPEAR